MTEPHVAVEREANAWPEALYNTLRAGGIEQAAYVPDAGHARLIDLLHADKAVHTTVLTTEEEGIAIACGAWLGGQRTVLLTQSSGVGNCVNMLSLVVNCRFPMLMLVTMRGEWAEFNPWQVPMGGATRSALELMGVKTYRVEFPGDVAPTVDAAMIFAFEAEQPAAVLLSQQMLGRKAW